MIRSTSTELLSYMDSFSPISEGDDGDFDSILRRNTYSKFSGGVGIDENPCDSPYTRPLSAERLVTCTSSKLNPKAFNALNSFNEMGHLSRRVIDTEGSNRLNSDDFKHAYGCGLVLERKINVEAITATTIATCVSNIIREQIVIGEDLSSEGHLNGREYDIFCGAGKNPRRSDDTNNEAVMSSPQKLKSLFKRFSSHVPPLSQIIDFIAKLCNDTQMEYECIIISLIYVRRLIKTSCGKFVLLSENWKGVFLSCVILANKVWDDFHMRNLDYTFVFKGLSIKRVNALESHLLQCLDCRCNVSPSAYAQTHFEIQAMITLMNIEKEKSKKHRRTNHAKVHPQLTSPTKNQQSPCKTPVLKIDVNPPIPELYSEHKSDGTITPTSFDEYTTFSPNAGILVPTVLTENGLNETEQPVHRKRITSKELEARNRNLLIHIKYKESSLIRTPSNKSGATGSQASSFKSAQRSRKVTRDLSRTSYEDLDLTSPPSEVACSKRKKLLSCVPFTSCCRFTKRIII